MTYKDWPPLMLTHGSGKSVNLLHTFSPGDYWGDSALGRVSTQGSRTASCDQQVSTFRMYRYTQNVYSCVRLYERKTDSASCLFWRQKYHLQWVLEELHDQEFQTFSMTFRLKEMTLKWQGRPKTQESHLVWAAVWMRIRLRNRYTLSMRCVRHKSDPHHQNDISNHRFISWRSGVAQRKPNSLQLYQL